MVEIYNDITVHERFARDQQEIEAFRKQYHLPPSAAGIVAVQTKILAFVPKESALSLLLQVYLRKLWAEFSIPKNYYLQRFASNYIAPSMGSVEKQKADVQKIEAILRHQTRGRFRRKEQEEREEGQEKDQERDEERMSEEEKAVKEGEALISLLEKGIIETNGMIDFVISRMHQFIQG